MNRNRSRAETISGIVILCVLFCLGVWIFTRAKHYNESAWFGRAHQTGETSAAAEIAPDAVELAGEIIPEGYAAMGDEEVFDSETLSDKINGKADLYLESGFASMRARRFFDKNNPETWFEVYLYNMGEPRNALTVFSLQRRKEGRDAPEIGAWAYTAGNAIFFMKGPWYVEIVSSSEDEAGASLIRCAQSLLSSLEGEELVFEELNLLPKDNMLHSSLKYFSSNGFGFHRLDRILAVNYQAGEREIMAFVSVRDNPEEAAELANAYYKFLLELGAESAPLQDTGIPGILSADVLGDLEIIFNHDRMLYGIHAATDRSAAVNLAIRMLNHANTER
ncbi:MAG TPA: hypothetical protein PLB62_03115 [Candidatus Sumerlaeota bacterium]|nr:hypothetical protein [Candidatus Sumerlaeota bacterium]